MREYDLSLWEMPVSEQKTTSIQIEKFIIDRITSGVVRPGEPIPSHRSLAKLYGVNRNTVLRAYTKLIGGGWLLHSKGSKAVVGNRAIAKSGGNFTAMPELLPTGLPTAQQESATLLGYRRIGFVALGQPFISSPSAFAKAMDRHGRRSEFSGANGGVSERLGMEILTQLNQRKFNILQEHLMVIRGRSECMRCIFGALCAPGEVVINTAPWDKLIHSVLGDRLLKVANLEVTEAGFLTQLEQLVVKTNCRAVYLRPGCSFPNCTHLDEASCLALIALAKRYGFYIIEEDDDHEFWWGKYPYKPMAQYSHDGHVVYCGALSRTTVYFQHLRTVIGAAQLTERLGRFCNGNFGFRDYQQEQALTGLLSDNELLFFSRQARMQKLKDRNSLHELLQLQLKEYVRYELPECGTGLWVEFKGNTDTSKLFSRIARDGQRIRPVVFPDSAGKTINHLRLDFSRFDLRECRQVAIKIREILKRSLKV